MGVTIELDGNVCGLLVVGLGQAGDLPVGAACIGLVELAHEMVDQMRKPACRCIPAEDRLRLIEQATELEQAAEVLRDALAKLQVGVPVTWQLLAPAEPDEQGCVAEIVVK